MDRAERSDGVGCHTDSGGYQLLVVTQKCLVIFRLLAFLLSLLMARILILDGRFSHFK